MPGLQKITSVRFFNKDLEMIGEVRNYTSLIFIRRWETFGEFELHTKIQRPDLFQQGNYIMLDNDPYRSGIILEHNDDTDGYGVNSLEDITIKGFSLLYKLFGRWTIPPPANNGYYIWNSKPVEDIMYDLVRDSAVNPTNNKRKIPHLVLGENKHRGEKLTYQSRLKRVSDELNALSLQSGLGISVKLDAENKLLVFEVLDGIDRSYAEDNPNSYVFSKKNRRVTKRKYSYTAKGMANMAYVAGQGDGEEREIETINDDLTGDDRWETYIDARDVEKESEESESNTTLADRGRVKLAEMSAAESYEFEANPIDYRELWDLGDICTFYDPENGGYMLFEIVTEIREVYEGDAVTVQPTFGHTSASISQSISAANSSGTTERAGLSAKFKVIFTEYAEIQTLVANKADIKDLTAITATVETLRAKTAEIQVLVADKASIGDLNAATARITELETDTADIRKAIIDVAHIGDLTAITADITNLKAGIADIDTAMIGKADIDLANIKNGCITTAMIGTGVIGTTQIADGSITDAKIVGLTANKITAGRLDAAQIEVVNLNAANITVGTINGVQIAPGAITGDKLAQQVNDQITGAASAAQQAQTTADGKNKIYYQNTQPGLTGNKKGDTWFDTANGYKAYVWDGTKWSASPFGSGALSDAVNSSITTAGSNASTALANAAAAKTAADQAAKDAQTAQSNANAAKTASDQAAKDLEAAEKNLAAVTGRVDATEEEIAAAQAAVTTAQNKANAAAQAAASAQTKADSAYTFADQAKKAAATAQTSADGKNTVFYQTAQPPTTGRKTGDTWFDTDDGNRIYRWDGSKWTAAPFGTNAIANAAITNALIANLDAGKITTGNLAAARIGAESITAEKLAAGSVIAGKLAANAVTASTIATGAINADKLAANSVIAGKIAANAVTAGTIAAGSVNADKLAAGAVTADKLAVGAVTADKIVANAITTAKIAAKAVTANEIAAGTITAAQIAANAITATQLAAGAVTAAKIAAGQITADKIAAGAITVDKFYGTAITSKNYVANSAGMKINLANGTIDTKNFKVDSAGNVAMTGTLTMQGAQSMTVKNASASLVGTVAFKAVSGQTWSPGALNVLGKDLLHLAAGDASTTKAFVEGYVGGYNLFEMGREGSNYGVWMGTSAAARIGVSNAQSPQVYAEGCTKIVNFTVASGFSKPSGELNNIVYNSMGKFCLLSFSLTGNVAAGTHTKILTVPAGYRPPGLIFSAGVGGVYGWFQIKLQADGGLYVWHPSGMTSFRGTILYYL
ncbi:Gp37-like protein [Eubacterium maltosivorans]|uniref:Gp28/Gp37-like domain-containing protein n=1 Tax=Eubacterium maltosivorans TaxID=2041044 RepID=A0A4P9C7K8_EUBML|nr:hypothetical protein [Eubacterium maltosivorans]QCT71518.1 hypothetical protein CPZ25_009330 [Eubacterium maltosivorans]